MMIFLTFNPFKRYNLIIANPPFTDGDKHLLHAIHLMRYGGQIVFLINAKTVKNPCTRTRKELVEKLSELNASIEYIENGFKNAERKTDVECALIYIDIPVKEETSEIYNHFKKIQEHEEQATECKGIETTDFIKSIVNQYRLECESGIRLITLYKQLKPYLNRSFDKDDNECLLRLTNTYEWHYRDITINEFLRDVSKKYWTALLANESILKNLPQEQKDKYRTDIENLASYEFSEYNIKTLLLDASANLKSSVENMLLKTFEKLTSYSTWNGCDTEYLYTGWKTNQAHALNTKKIIIPLYCFESIFKRFYSYKCNFLIDLEKILDYFAGDMYSDDDYNLYKILDTAFNSGITQKIKCKYWEATFYKKGTVHLKWLNRDVIDRYNIYVGKQNQWLPPSYGAKAYNNMTEQEKRIVDEFQGKERYNKIIQTPSKFLIDPLPKTQQLLLTGG